MITLAERERCQHRQKEVALKLDMFRMALDHFLGCYPFSEEELATIEQATSALFEVSQNMAETTQRERNDKRTYGRTK